MTFRTILALAGALAILLLAVAAATLPRDAATPSIAGVPYGNPVFARDFPDPYVLRPGTHNYYAYATATGWEKGFFPILHSRDAVHWRYTGDIFSVTDRPQWSETDYWAPDVIRRGGTYFAYFVGSVSGTHCIGVATAGSPTGPFHDRGVVSCGYRGGSGFIDPDVYRGAGGHAYLYVSVDEPHHIAVVPLQHSLLRPSGSARRLFGVSQRWESGPDFTTVEGPYLFTHGGRYYLLYSGNSYNTDYAEGYATAPGPLGPFTKCACNPVLRGDGRVKGPGGGSVFTGPDGQLWLAYHGWGAVEGYEHGGARSLRLGPLQWDGTRLSIPVTP
jgi:beta-xylosidase